MGTGVLYIAALVLVCHACSVAGIPCLSAPELLEVELFQVGYGVARRTAQSRSNLQTNEPVREELDTVWLERLKEANFRNESLIRTMDKLAGVDLDDRDAPIGMLAVLVETASKADMMTWALIAVGLGLPCLAQFGVMYLGDLPPARAKERQAAQYPPISILITTAVCRIGVMANTTVVLPFASDMASSSGFGVQHSGFLIAVYSFGATSGLLIFHRIPVERWRIACMVHCVLMFIGNVLWAYAGHVHSFMLLTVSRMIVGLEAGVHYNGYVAIILHTSGAAQTSCLILFQTFVALGVLLGPLLAALGAQVALWVAADEIGALREGAGNIIMALWGVAFFIALMLFGPLPEPSQERLAESRGECQGRPGSGIPVPEVPADGEELARKSRSALAVFLFFVQSGFLRMMQRLLFESGIIFLLQEHYNWSPSQTGLVMLPIGIFTVSVQLIFSIFLAGKYSDKGMMLAMEVLQLFGLLFMLQGGEAGRGSFPVTLLLGGSLAYAANSVWGGVANAYCTKREVPGTCASAETMMVGNHLSLFAGICVGAWASRAVLGASPSPSLLTMLLLATCGMQLMASLLTLEMHQDGTHAMIALVVSGALMVCAVVPALGGLGFSSGVAWHIAFMGLAWAGAGPLALWVSKTQQLPKAWQNEHRHLLHSFCMALNGVLTVAGLCAGIADRRYKHQSGFGGLGPDETGHLVAARGWSHTIHVLLGLATLGGVLVHAVVLSATQAQLLSSGHDSNGSKWHETLARWISSLAILCAMVGIWMPWKGGSADGVSWSTSFKTGLSAGLVFLGCVVYQKDAPKMGKNCS